MKSCFEVASLRLDTGDTGTRDICVIKMQRMTPDKPITAPGATLLEHNGLTTSTIGTVTVISFQTEQ